MGFIDRVRVEKDPRVALELLFRGTVALELKSPVIAQLLASPQPESHAFAQKLAELESAGERGLGHDLLGEVSLLARGGAVQGFDGAHEAGAGPGLVVPHSLEERAHLRGEGLGKKARKRVDSGAFRLQQLVQAIDGRHRSSPLPCLGSRFQDTVIRL